MLHPIVMVFGLGGTIALAVLAGAGGRDMTALDRIVLLLTAIVWFCCWIGSALFWSMRDVQTSLDRMQKFFDWYEKIERYRFKKQHPDAEREWNEAIRKAREKPAARDTAS